MSCDAPLEPTVAFVTDLDGTLVLAGQGQLGTEGRAEIKAATARGVGVVLATGRTPGSVAALVADLPLLGVVLCNGAAVVDLDARSVLVRSALDGTDLTRLSSVLARLAPAAPLTAAALLSAPLSGRVAFRDVQKTAIYHGVDRDMQALKLVVTTADHSEAVRLADRMRLEFGIDYVVAATAGRSVEVTAAGSGKRDAVREVLARSSWAGVPTVAVGDGDNDAEMLAWATWGYAVENGSTAALAAARNRVSGPGAETSGALGLLTTLPHTLH